MNALTAGNALGIGCGFLAILFTIAIWVQATR